MLHANPKTRRQNQTAGESVDVQGYLRKMADNATDGDHLTLQVGWFFDKCVCVCGWMGGCGFVGHVVWFGLAWFCLDAGVWVGRSVF